MNKKVDNFVEEIKSTKDKNLDQIFWFRIFFGAIVGTVAGSLSLTGIFVVGAYIVAMFLLSYIYYARVLQVNEDDYKENELFMEGFGPAMGLFMVSLFLFT